MTEFVTSKDGTKIAYTRRGQGPVLIHVDGAFCHRGFGPAPKLAPLLAEHFTVITYDRRGRGESGDTQPYAVEREIEDIRALADEIGGPVYLEGTSSGAVLAMRAASAGVPTRALVLYEAPLVSNGSPGELPPARMAQIEQRVAEGERSQAAASFLTMVGMPGFMVPAMKLMWWVWRDLKSAAHTLPYDFAVLGHAQSDRPLPTEIVEAAKGVPAPAMVVEGGKSPPYMRHAADTLAELMPVAQRRTLPKQAHNVSPKVYAPAVAEFCQGAEG